MNKSIVKIAPCKLKGTIKAPASKSILHRAIICSVLSFDKSTISNIDLSDDILATINAFKEIGVNFVLEDNILYIDSTNIDTSKDIIVNCNESGSTLRFLIPIFSALSIKTTFVGKESLITRPIDVYIDALSKTGVKIYKHDRKKTVPLSIESKIKPAEFFIRGDISSQFISGLLFSLPLLDKESYIYLTSPLESKGYVDMTIDILKKYNINIEILENGFRIPKNQKYKATSFSVESDFSQAAFFLASNLLSSNVKVSSLNINSLQPDKHILDILKCFGANICIDDNTVIVKKGSNIKSIEIDISQNPDLLPIISVICCFCDGRSRIYGAQRLKYKESDRLSSTANALNAIGGRITKLDDSLIIDPIKKFHKGIIDGCNDHRIVMAMSIAATASDSEIIISDAMSINKSYPNFFNDYSLLGGNANVINFR